MNDALHTIIIQDLQQLQTRKITHYIFCVYTAMVDTNIPQANISKTKFAKQEANMVNIYV